jgi:hypothetical protein
MDHRFVAGGLWVVGLLSYIATARIGRRSPHYGGGTRVLSWVGLVIPCIAWVAMFQGYFAVDRSAREADAASAHARRSDRSQFLLWSAVYAFAMIVGGALYPR